MKLIERVCNYSYFTNVLGLSRSLLAFATLSTLVLNSNNNLFYAGLNDEISIKCNGVNNISIYCILNQDLLLAKVLSILVLILVISGWYPRVTGILHWWVTYSLSVSAFLVDGGDQIASILTLLLIPITLSDGRRNHWASTSKQTFYSSTVGYFSAILIKIQVAVIYFHSATGKFPVAEWIDGTALYYWFTSHNFGAPTWFLQLFGFALKSPVLITLTTWSVLVLELFLAVSLFLDNPKIRKKLFYIGVAFHFGILVIHGLFSFFFTMVAALIFLLLYPNVITLGSFTKATLLHTLLFLKKSSK